MICRHFGSSVQQYCSAAITGFASDLMSFSSRLCQPFHSKHEDLDFELDAKQRAAADLAYCEKSANDSLRHLLILCLVYLLHIVVHTPIYSNRIPALVSAIMFWVVLLSFYGAFRMSRLTSKRGAGWVFKVLIVTPFFMQHLTMVASETYVQKRIYFQSGSVFKHLRPPPNYCDSMAACDAWQFARQEDIMINVEVSGYCARAMVEPRVDVEQLWVIMLVDVYYILMVLSARQSLFFFIPGLSLYVVPLLLLGGRLDEGGWPIVTITCAVALLCIWIKFAKESTSRKLLESLEFQKKYVIDEKIKRCAAEFEADRLKEVVVSFSKRGSEQHVNSSSSVTSKSQTQASTAASAPAACMIPYKGACNGEDCLLESSRVVVEGASDSLQELRELQEGHRVLCQDTLTGSFEFVEVSGIQATDCPDEIIRLVLEDERIIDMTPDHPMPVIDGSNGKERLEVVQAKNLHPKLHALNTWQCNSVKIDKVLTVRSQLQSTGDDATALNHGKVQVLAIDSQLSDRYRMLVTGPKGEAQFGDAPTFVAVGFANLSLFKAGAKHGFLDVSVENSQSSLRRSVSDPAVYDLPAVASTPSITYLSLGSRGHNNSRCKPCNIQQRYLEGKFKDPCKLGESCKFCHEPHNRKDRRARRHNESQI